MLIENLRFRIEVEKTKFTCYKDAMSLQACCNYSKLENIFMNYNQNSKDGSNETIINGSYSILLYDDDQLLDNISKVDALSKSSYSIDKFAYALKTDSFVSILKDSSDYILDKNKFRLLIDVEYDLLDEDYSNHYYVWDINCSVFLDKILDIYDTNLKIVVLETLGYIENNLIDIKDYPIYISDMLKLFSLNASNRNIVDISGLEYATNLDTLNLSRNKIYDLPTHIFDNLGNLIKLNLSDNNISNLSSDIFNNLTKLNSLDISDNDISNLPNEIFDKLNSLTNLNLSNNSFSSLQNDLFNNIINLTNLKLDNNNISTLPNGIFDKLIKLSTLSLDNNNISTLHISIFSNLTNLFKLSLDYNNISTLPNGIFDKLPKLSWLSLQNNKIQSLPSGIFNKLPKLSWLLLNSNNILETYFLDDFNYTNDSCTIEVSEQVITFEDISISTNGKVSFNMKLLNNNSIQISNISNKGVLISNSGESNIAWQRVSPNTILSFAFSGGLYVSGSIKFKAI